MSERRQHPRLQVRLLVQHQANVMAALEEHPEIDYATDMSRGGLFIASKNAPVARSTVHVQFAPARDSRLVSTFVRVTHVTKNGFGAQFIGLDREASALIESLLPMDAVDGAAMTLPAPAMASSAYA